MRPIGVSLLIPAYNEAAPILGVLERIVALELDVEIIVVDDGSADGTSANVESFAAHYPGVVVLLRQPNRGKGSAGRLAATRITKEIAVIQDADMETGYKAFRSEVLLSLRLTQDDFAIEPEITGEVCRRGLRVYEMPIAYYGRTYSEGKNVTWRDGVKAVFVLLRVRLRRR